MQVAARENESLGANRREDFPDDDELAELSNAPAANPTPTPRPNPKRVDDDDDDDEFGDLEDLDFDGALVFACRGQNI